MIYLVTGSSYNQDYIVTNFMKILAKYDQYNQKSIYLTVFHQYINQQSLPKVMLSPGFLTGYNIQCEYVV